MLDQRLEAAKAKETETIRKLAARLPRESVARKCAEALLSGSAIKLEWPTELCKLLPPKRTADDPEPLVAAWCLGRIPSSIEDRESALVALKTLLRPVVGNGTGRRLTRNVGASVVIGWLGSTVAAFAIICRSLPAWDPQRTNSVIAAVLASLAFGGLAGILIAMLGAGWHRGLRIREIATGVRSLGLLAEPAAITSLDEQAGRLSPSIREAAQTALESCIGAIRASHYRNLPSEVIPTLCKLLKTAGPGRKLAILQALAYAGDGRAVEAVRPLTEDPLSDRIRDLAQRVLPILEARKAQETAAATLLRPSSLQDEPAQVLLRPASGVAGVPDEQLLRPSSGDGGRRDG